MSLEAAIRMVESRPAAYVLMSADCDYMYKGACRDLRRRLADHWSGRVSSTKGRRPLTLIHMEYCVSYKDALIREKFLKSGVGRNMLCELVKKGLPAEGRSACGRKIPWPKGREGSTPSPGTMGAGCDGKNEPPRRQERQWGEG